MILCNCKLVYINRYIEEKHIYRVITKDESLYCKYLILIFMILYNCKLVYINKYIEENIYIKLLQRMRLCRIYSLWVTLYKDVYRKGYIYKYI